MFITHQLNSTVEKNSALIIRGGIIKNKYGEKVSCYISFTDKDIELLKSIPGGIISSINGVV